MSYEGLLLIGPLMIITFLYSAALDLRDDSAVVDLEARLGLQLVLFVSLSAYFSWGWSAGRVTLPMQTLQLVLVDASTGGPISRGRAARRFLLAVPLVITGLGLLLALGREDRATLYDQWAGTRLVMRPRRTVP